MGLKRHSLLDTIISRISIDEFEPKTGELEDVIVVGFRTTDEPPAKDLYNYINNSFIEVRDVEVSPNPNPEGYFLVFVELDRKTGVLDTIRELVSEIENVSGKLKWKASTHITGDDYYPLNGDDIQNYVFQTPEEYMSKEEYEQQDLSADMEEGLYEFFRSSSLEKVSLNEKRITLTKGKTSATLEIIGFGSADTVMKEAGIADRAIKSLDLTYRKFNTMLGEMKALPIGDYVVIYDPKNSSHVLVGKTC